MKTISLMVILTSLGILTGCGGKYTHGREDVTRKRVYSQRADGLHIPSYCYIYKKPKAIDADELYITVNFQENQTLRYKFISSRDIELNWKPGKDKSRGKIDKSAESMEMIVAYEPVKIDSYGLATIKATCESVKVRRDSKARSSSRKDAVKTLTGKTFTLIVSPTGKIEDYSQLEELIKKTGEKAFRPSSRPGRIKEPDMISDFFASQWFLWDSVSSIENALAGLSVGQSWNSQLSVPAPMILRKARDVTYTLTELRPAENGTLAIINSSFLAAESVPDSWPMPYSGRFQVSGKFGFLRGYKMLGLKGSGQEIFNIDLGRIESYNQQYELKLRAASPFGLGVRPEITINQKLTMTLLEN